MMFNSEREQMIFYIEEYYCSKMDQLFRQERFDDANSIFEEFVIETENPNRWLFLEDLSNVS